MASVSLVITNSNGEPLLTDKPKAAFPTSIAAGGAGLPEDGKAPRGSATQFISVRIDPISWRAITAAAQRASVPIEAWVSTAFAFVLQRLGGEPANLCVKKDAALAILTIDVAASPDFAMAALAAAQSIAAQTRADEKVSAGASPYGFLLLVGDDSASASPTDWPGEDGWALGAALREPINEIAGELLCAFDPARFSRGRIQGLAEAYLGVLRDFSSAPFRNANTFAIASTFDRAKQCPRNPPPAPCALDNGAERLDVLFATAALAWPNAVAAAWLGGHATFGDISAAADEVAGALSEAGATNDDIVAFRLPPARPDGRCYCIS